MLSLENLVRIWSESYKEYNHTEQGPILVFQLGKFQSAVQA